MAADIPIPKTLLVHGFINVGDTKIGKSLGNVISSEDLIERFQLDNADPVRYYMMTSTGFGQDGSYTDEEFKNKINADLANNLGNLLNRTLNMLNKYFDGQVPTPDATARQIVDEASRKLILEKYNGYAFNESLDAIMGLVDQANKYVNDAEPWTLHKEGKIQELGNVMYSILETLRQVAIMLSPVVPTLSQSIWEQLGYTTPLQAIRWNALKDSPLPAGQVTALGSPILPRLDSEIVGAGKKK
jgi:methionyl-tRNA synthetase